MTKIIHRYPNQDLRERIIGDLKEGSQVLNPPRHQARSRAAAWVSLQSSGGAPAKKDLHLTSARWVRLNLARETKSVATAADGFTVGVCVSSYGISTMRHTGTPAHHPIIFYVAGHQAVHVPFQQRGIAFHEQTHLDHHCLDEYLTHCLSGCSGCIHT